MLERHNGTAFHRPAPYAGADEDLYLDRDGWWVARCAECDGAGTWETEYDGGHGYCGAYSSACEDCEGRGTNDAEAHHFDGSRVRAHTGVEGVACIEGDAITVLTDDDWEYGPFTVRQIVAILPAQVAS